MSKGAVAQVVIPYRPRPVWAGFHASPARWRVAVAHRRAGKTVAFVNEAIRAALSCPQPDARIAYVSTARGKRKLQGLVNRRAAEVVLWSTDEPGSLDEHPPSSVTREVGTPPVASNPRPLAKEPVFALTIGGAILGAPGLIAKAIETLTPYAQQSPQVRDAVEILSALGPIAAGLAALFVFLQKQQASR